MAGRRPSPFRPGHNTQEMFRAVAAIRAAAMAGAIEIAAGIVALSNEGGDGAPPAPIDKGELRGSPRVTINAPSTETSDSGAGSYPLTAEADVRKAIQLSGFALGDTIFVTWIAGHANIIEGGRRQDKNGRMIGSLQAPDGWVWPAVEVQLARMDRWKYGGGNKRSRRRQ